MHFYWVTVYRWDCWARTARGRWKTSVLGVLHWACWGLQFYQSWLLGTLAKLLDLWDIMKLQRKTRRHASLNLYLENKLNINAYTTIMILNNQAWEFSGKSRHSCFFGQNLCIFLPFQFHDVLGLFDKIPCFFVKSHSHAWNNDHALNMRDRGDKFNFNSLLDVIHQMLLIEEVWWFFVRILIFSSLIIIIIKTNFIKDATCCLMFQVERSCLGLQIYKSKLSWRLTFWLTLSAHEIFQTIYLLKNRLQ